MKSYLFFLGQNEALSKAEVESLLPEANLDSISPHLLKVNANFDLDKLSCQIGGTTKIAVLLSENVDPKDLEITLTQLITDQFTKNFSILTLDSTDSYSLAADIKKNLIGKGIKARFIAGDSKGLSPLVVAKQKVTELVVTESGDIYHTVWVHPFKNWIIRDRKKPFITPKSGMLPPKLARIMVNLGMGDKNPKNLTLLDPFCGTGTVLMEAALLGAKVIGSDLSGEKVQGTHTNLEWLPSDHACSELKTPRLLVADATNLSHFLKEKVDVVVTEPTLGPPSPKEQNLANLAKGLQKLYIGMLNDWRKFLDPGARLVIAFPIFHGRNRSYSTTNFIDSRENLGYNVLRKDLIFTRPGAQIERQIVILEKQ